MSYNELVTKIIKVLRTGDYSEQEILDRISSSTKTEISHILQSHNGTYWYSVLLNGFTESLWVSYTPKLSNKLIGIVGPIGSGKTFTGEYLCNDHGYVQYAIAEPLKAMARVLGFDKVDGTQKEKLQIHPEWGISTREFLQKFGTEVCRDFLPKVLPDMNLKPSIWLKMFDTYWDSQPGNVVVSDVRFADEAESIRAKGGLLIRLVRVDGCFNEEKTHVTESESMKIVCDLEVKNCGTEFFIDTLIEKLKRVDFL